MIYIQALGTDKEANQRAFDIIFGRYRPSKTIIVATKESIKFLPDGIKPDEIIIVDSDDIKSIFEKLKERIKDNDDEIMGNVTTGTKAMVVAIALFTYEKRGKIVYIGGERKGEKVITGSEEIFEYDIR